MSSLENRGNGSWRVTISDGYGPDGRKKYLKRTIKVDPNKTELSQRREAETQAALIEADYRRHLLTDNGKVRFAKAAEDYLQMRRITEKTRNGYRVLLEGRILPSLGGYYVQDITPAMLNKFFHELTLAPAGKRSKNGYLSGDSQLHYFTLVRAILNFCVKSGWITYNPIVACDAPHNDVEETEYYEPEEVSLLLDALDKLPDIMWTAYFYMAIYTGARPEEMIGANWSDLKNNVFHIAHGAERIKGVGTVRTPAPKTASSIRDVVLPDDVMQLLQQWKEEQASYRSRFGNDWAEPDAMFTGDLGKRLDLSTPTQKFQKILKANNLRHIKLYSLRHTCASILIASGRDIRSVADLLGHSTPSLTLKTYSHSFDKTKQENANALSAAIAAARKK